MPAAGSLLVSATAGDGYASIQAARPADLTTGEHYLPGLPGPTIPRRAGPPPTRRHRPPTANRRGAESEGRRGRPGRPVRPGPDRPARRARLSPAQADTARRSEGHRTGRSPVHPDRAERVQGAAQRAPSGIRLDRRAAPSTAQLRAGAPAHCDARPVPGPISSGFGPRVDPVSGAQGFHPGDDLEATYGTPHRLPVGDRRHRRGARAGTATRWSSTTAVHMATLYGHQSRLAVSRTSAGERGRRDQLRPVPPATPPARTPPFRSAAQQQPSRPDTSFTSHIGGQFGRPGPYLSG